jgi:hypothetical protein
MDLHLVDARQSPVAVEWPTHMSELKKAIEINVKGHGTVHPFYVESHKAAAKPEAVGREIMLAIGISGSMTQRLADGRAKFEAAKEAINGFLDNFQDESTNGTMINDEEVEKGSVMRLRHGDRLSLADEAVLLLRPK